MSGRDMDPEVLVTFFEDWLATSLTARTIAWPTLATEIRQTTAAQKVALPWLKLARFGDRRSDKGSLRHDANVLGITGIEADYDGGTIPFAEAVDVLTRQGLRALVYTSPSHTEDTPRWRILCPATGELPPGRRQQLLGRLNGLFRGIFSAESWTLSQAYFYGSVRNNPSHQVVLVEGSCIDQADELDEIWQGKPGTKGTAGGGARHTHGPVDEEALLAQIIGGENFHQATVRLAGAWAFAGIPMIEARRWLEAAFDRVADDQRDDRWRARRADIPRCLLGIYSAEASKSDRQDAPDPAWDDPLSEDAFHETDDEAAQAADSPPARPVIRFVPGELHTVVDKAEQAMLAARLGVYQRGSFLVRTGRLAAGVEAGHKIEATKILPVGNKTLVELMTKAADWLKYDGRSCRWKPVNTPNEVADTYLQRTGHWRAPVLAAVLSAPTLRSDGSILEAEGYDPQTGLLLDFGGIAFPAIPPAPDWEDARSALSILIRLTEGFPFVREADRAVALSAILTACIRHALPTAPLHAFSAPVAGSGKSMLVDLASEVANGRVASVMAQSQDEGEMEKRLGALLLAGDPMIAIDNCEHPLGGDLLCQILTQTSVRTRILGRSEMPELPSRVLVTATGNNLRLVGDMSRRAVLCQLDPECERPETRCFDVNPLDLVRVNRSQYLVAALTALRAYHVVGEPNQSQPLGSFEAWSRTVRDTLIWLGQPDPVETMEKVREIDPKRDALLAVLHAWRSVLNAQRVRTQDIIETATRQDKDQSGFVHKDFREALLRVAGDGGVISSRRLGIWIAHNEARVVDGMRIMRVGVRSGAPTWQVATSSEASIAA